MMEEIREEKIGQILSWLQAVARGHLARLTYKKLKAQKVNNSVGMLLYSYEES